MSCIDSESLCGSIVTLRALPFIVQGAHTRKSSLDKWVREYSNKNVLRGTSNVVADRDLLLVAVQVS